MPPIPGDFGNQLCKNIVTISAKTLYLPARGSYETIHFTIINTGQAMLSLFLSCIYGLNT